MSGRSETRPKISRRGQLSHFPTTDIAARTSRQILPESK
jgi:hypothetical protein